MEPAVTVALIAGGMSLTGIALQVKATFFSAKNSRAAADGSNENARSKQIDDRSQWWVEHAEERAKAAEEKTANLEAKFESLQGRHLELLERTEELEKRHIRDQAQIEECTNKITALEERANNDGS